MPPKGKSNKKKKQSRKYKRKPVESVPDQDASQQDVDVTKTIEDGIMSTIGEETKELEDLLQIIAKEDKLEILRLVKAQLTELDSRIEELKGILRKKQRALSKDSKGLNLMELREVRLMLPSNESKDDTKRDPMEDSEPCRSSKSPNRL